MNAPEQTAQPQMTVKKLRMLAEHLDSTSTSIIFTGKHPYFTPTIQARMRTHSAAKELRSLVGGGTIARKTRVQRTWGTQSQWFLYTAYGQHAYRACHMARPYVQRRREHCQLVCDFWNYKASAESRRLTPEHIERVLEFAMDLRALNTAPPWKEVYMEESPIVTPTPAQSPPPVDPLRELLDRRRAELMAAAVEPLEEPQEEPPLLTDEELEERKQRFFTRQEERSLTVGKLAKKFSKILETPTDRKRRLRAGEEEEDASNTD